MTDTKTATRRQSAHAAAMDAALEVHGPFLTGREMDIAATAARAAYYFAYREVADLMQERAENAK